MRFALYCRELRAGGGAAVGAGLVKALAAGSWKHEITAYVPAHIDYDQMQGGGIRIETATARGGGHHLRSHHRLRHELCERAPDALFMLGNMGLVGAPCR